MNSYDIVNSKYFVVTGISHEKTEIEEREKFTLTDDKVKELMLRYKELGGEGIFVLSTCNRTEIYALANDINSIQQLFSDAVKVDPDTFQKNVYSFSNESAILHLLQVGVGLKSQIPGDFQIIGQIKAAFKQSKKLNASHPFLERLINVMIQCSKQVKNETNFSSGTTSASYAAVEYIRKSVENFKEKNFLLYGSGKIGKHVCENLNKHVTSNQITLINRTDENAIQLAAKTGVNAVKHEEINEALNQADIVLVSTGANHFTIESSMYNSTSSKVFVDLSMPRNVSPDVVDNNTNILVGLDQLTAITDQTIEERQQAIDEVNKIICKSFTDFMEWLEHRKLVPTINAIREKLQQIQENEINRFKKENVDINENHLQVVSADIIKKFTNQITNQLKSLPKDNIEMVHHLFQIDSQKF